jgi:ankyrin repeat protein
MLMTQRRLIMKRVAALFELLLFIALSAPSWGAPQRGEIIRAEYGYGNHWTDATQRVESLARGNDFSFRVDDATLGVTSLPGQPEAALRNDPASHALHFDGVDDYVEVPPSPALDLRGSLTVSAWVRSDGVRRSAEQIFWRGDLQAGLDPYFLVINDGKMAFCGDVEGNQRWSASDPSPVDLNFHFWTGVYDTEARQARLYKDGALVASSPAEGKINYATAQMWNSIGAVDHGSWQNFHGAIAEIQVWIGARTGTQIGGDIRGDFTNSDPALAGRWDFREGEGQVLHDRSQHANNGRLGASDGADNHDLYWRIQTQPAALVANPRISSGGGAPSGYTFCSDEGQRCNFSGTTDIAYGANGQFYYRYGMTGGVECNNDTFNDPIDGVRKACYIKTSSGVTHLGTEAPSYGKKDAIEWFIDKGADLNSKESGRMLPIHSAAENGNVEAVALLLAKGTDVNTRSDDGRTTLHWAASACCIGTELLELLVSKGADVNAKDKGGATPLHVAAMYSNAKYIQWLLAKGADVHVKDYGGSTPLHYVRTEGDMKKSVELLLAKGADINAKDNGGHTPIHGARYFDEKKLVELLLKLGAKEE